MYYLNQILLCLLINLAVIAASTTRGKNKNLGFKDCFGISGDSSAIICRVIPVCDENTSRLYQQYTRIVFDLENKYRLSAEQFYNCSFSWSSKIELEFKNIRVVSKYAFESIKLDRNVKLTIKFDGSGLNLDKNSKNKRLVIKKDAFKNARLIKRSQLLIEIYKYGQVDLEDNLSDSIYQDENSELHINIHDCDELNVKQASKQQEADNSDYQDEGDMALKQLKISHETPNTNLIFKNNLTYTLEMLHLNSLKLDPQVFSGLQVNPYSVVSIIVRFVHNCYLGDNLFDTLMLGTYSQFNLVVESVTSLGMGNFMFNGMQQDQFSVFYLQIDQIGLTSSKRIKRSSDSDNLEYEDDYYDYEYQDIGEQEEIVQPRQQESSSFNNWLCIPEGFFKNVQQYESALAQIHFSQIDMSLSFSTKAFSEIQLSENSKFQILLQDINGHILFDRNAINLIKLSDGLFEIWTENHKQQDLIRGNNRGNNVKKNVNSNNSNQFSQQKKKTSRKETYTDTLKFMKSVQNSYFKLQEYSINQIFLTSRSYFRFGFVNSDSIFLLNPKSLNGFHIERFESNRSISRTSNDYRTKIEFEINDSENVKFNFLYKDVQIKQNPSSGSSSTNVDYEFDDEDVTQNLPKLIELDGYQPIMSQIRPDGTIEDSVDSMSSSKTLNSSKIIIANKKPKPTTLTAQTKEFCQFYTLRPYMASIQRANSLIKSSLTQNLVYFTESTKFSSELDTKSSKLTCTSCLYIYLYRTIQRRVDFYYVKDHLPSCFINLHFKNSLHFLSTTNQKERHQLIANIEQSFKYYWKILNCKSVTGLDSILDYDADMNEIDESLADYDTIAKNCKEKLSINNKFNEEAKLVANLNPKNWHDKSLKICSKNILDSKANVSVPITNLKRKINKILGTNDGKGKNFPLAIIILIMVATSVAFIFIYFKYKRPKRPCIRLNFNRPNIKSFQRLTNNTGSTRSGLASNPINSNNNNNEDNEVEQSYDELNGYEYDDEFEMNNADLTPNRNVNCSNSSENVEFRLEPESDSSNKIESLKERSIKKIRNLKNNIFNKDLLKLSLLNVTNMSHPHFSATVITSNGVESNKKYARYGYNSTESTLVQTKTRNEFELPYDKTKKHVIEEDDDGITNLKSNSIVTFEKNKKNFIKTNIVKNTIEMNDADKLLLNGTNDSANQMRLATNPMGILDYDLEMDLEMEDIGMNNEFDQDPDEDESEENDSNTVKVKGNTIRNKNESDA